MIIAIKIYNGSIVYAVFLQLSGKHHVLERIPYIIHHNVKEFRGLLYKIVFRHQSTAAGCPRSEHITDTALYSDAVFGLHTELCCDGISSVEIDAADVFRENVWIFADDPYGILAVHLVDSDGFIHFYAEFAEFDRGVGKLP